MVRELDRREWLRRSALLSLAGVGLMKRETSANQFDTESQDALDDLARGQSEFAFDLFQRLRHREGNLFFSPYSISTAMSMASLGARNETERQMLETLHIERESHATVGRLISALQRPGSQKKYSLNVTNSMWGQAGYPFNEEFLIELADHYESELREIDFFSDPEEARKTINKWVAEQTRDKIDELLGEDTIDRLTTLVLVNAIYFKAKWATPFSDRLTRDMPFHLGDGERQAVPMMSMGGELRHVKRDGYSALELPYESNQLSMIMFLPDEDSNLSMLERRFDLDFMSNVDASLESKYVSMRMPKFSSTSQFSLEDVLSAMGMPDAFEMGKADFSGITKAESLAIGKVIHEAFVEVDEAGTEATAATAVTLFRGGRPRIEAEFYADRPFLYGIRENATNSLLFLGRVSNPVPN